MRKRFVRTMMITSMLAASLSLAACSKNEETDKGGLPTTMVDVEKDNTSKGDAETTSKVEDITLNTSEEATTEANAEVTTPSEEATTPSEAPTTKVEDEMEHPSERSEEETTTKVEEEATTNEPTTKVEPTTKKETTTKVEATTKEKETTTKVEPTTKEEATTKKEEATTKPASKPVEESTTKPMEESPTQSQVETPTQVGKDTVSRDKYGNASTYTFKGMHVAYRPEESNGYLDYELSNQMGSFVIIEGERKMADYVDANCGDGSKPNPYKMHEWTTRKYYGERDEVTVGYYCYYEDLYSDSHYDYNGVYQSMAREIFDALAEPDNNGVKWVHLDSTSIKVGTYEGKDVYFHYVFKTPNI